MHGSKNTALPTRNFNRGRNTETKHHHIARFVFPGERYELHSQLAKIRFDNCVCYNLNFQNDLVYYTTMNRREETTSKSLQNN
jgi:TnpA family transposase